jgi:polyphenol oxidase
MPVSEPRPNAFLGPVAGWPTPVRVVTTTRVGGFGSGPWATFGLSAGGGDDPATVDANRARLTRLLGLPAPPLWLQQVHGTDVVDADAHADTDTPPQADGAWTRSSGVVCTVLTADCLPVVLAANDGSAVAVAHAGWRGLAAGVIESALDRLPVPPNRVHAWLGPAIGPRAFEVGPEVREAFVATDSAQAEAFRRGEGDRWWANLYALARRRLRRAGVTHMSGGGWCTYGQPELFFSHRRDQGQTGRMATLAWLASR